MNSKKPLTPELLFLLLILWPLVMPLILTNLAYFFLGTFAVSKLPIFKKKK